MLHVSQQRSRRHLQVRAGVQARSRRSLERILAATEHLLTTRLFEEVSMAEIAERAGVAVGTVYLRFPSKEALVPALFDRHNAVVGTRVEALARDLQATSTLRQRIDLLATFAVDYHVKHRGLLRALTAYVRANPAIVDPSLFAQREAMYLGVAQMLVGDAREVVRDDPVESAVFAVGVINSVCREQILFGDVSPLSRRSGQREAMARRLADLVERELAGTVSRRATRRSR